MKKYLCVLTVITALVACGGGASSSSTEKSTTPNVAANDMSSNPDYQKGLELVAKNDCLTCHKVDETTTGPAYRLVANKYSATEENIAMLANKIIKGGSGVWGQVPMTPHPQLAEADAKQIVKYILLLRNK